MFGWQDYVITDGSGMMTMTRLPPGVPPNLALSLFEITGLTAYFGVLDVGQVKTGETFVVSGAAGATGWIAGQIAKIKGCRVIGTAGGKAKCDWLVSEAGIDGAIDYRSEDLGKRLGELCPDGIDVFFDNVGGAVLNEALARTPPEGEDRAVRRVLALQRRDPRSRSVELLFNLILCRGRMEGFIVLDYAARFAEATNAPGGLAASGLAQSEGRRRGWARECAQDPGQKQFTGENFGKQLLNIADPPLGPT